MAATSRTPAQRRMSISGLRKMPPPVPVSPESRPIALPLAIAAPLGAATLPARSSCCLRHSRLVQRDP